VTSLMQHSSLTVIPAVPGNWLDTPNDIATEVCQLATYLWLIFVESDELLLK